MMISFHLSFFWLVYDAFPMKEAYHKLAELQDTLRSHVEIERAWVKVLEDDLSIAKACESELDKDLQATMADAHY